MYFGLSYSPSLSVLGLANMSNTRLWTCLTAKSTHFELSCPPSPDALGLTNMLDPRYMDLVDCQVMHFRLSYPPSPNVLGLANMSDSRYMDLADCKVHALWTWLFTKYKRFGSGKHAKPTLYGLDWLLSPHTLNLAFHQVQTLWVW